MTIIDANGLVTNLTYDVRMRLTGRSVTSAGGNGAGTETTQYQYDGVGQLTQVTLPDGAQLTYTYDAAHRLTSLADSLGNRLTYTLDLMGNRVKEDTTDPQGQLAQTKQRIYNPLNRLIQDIGAQNQTTSYTQDANGNVTSITDPLGRITTQTYDALNRLVSLTQPAPAVGAAAPVINYAYNGQDQLTQVTDPRNLITRYGYDGLANLNSLQSPDTGTTNHAYDANGNLTASTDAKGQTSSHSYDALNRITQTVYSAGAGSSGTTSTGNQLKTITYQYDLAPSAGAGGTSSTSTYPIGRLSQVTETAADGSTLQLTQYRYDQRGRLTEETRQLAGTGGTGGTGTGAALQPYTTTYRYDGSTGRMLGMTYPSGRSLDYSYDAIGRITQMSTTNPALSATTPTQPNPGQTQLLATNIQYHPSVGGGGSPVKAYTLGNNQTITRTIDQDGRLASYTLASSPTTLTYDAASRIVSLIDTTNPTNSTSYAYDNLDRLTQAILPASTAPANYSYGYDATGNRTDKSAGSSTSTLTIDPQSNRIAQLSTGGGGGGGGSGGTVNRSFQYDPNGSTTADGARQLSYDLRGRLIGATAVSSTATTGYQVNAMGQRVRKIAASASSPANPPLTANDTLYHYDAQGRLIAETTPSGVLKKEYLYLQDLPVAVSVQ